MNKKIKILLSLSLLISLSLVGCSKDIKKEGQLVIGINQLMEHPALDDAREGFIRELEDLGIEAEIKYMNAQGDIPNSISIAEKFAKDKVDLIYAIGTPAAQSTKQVTKDIPILFSAVTDPVASGLVDSWDKVGGNVTGSSDRADILEQLKLFKAINKDVKTIGIIYNTGESNSEIQIKEVEKLLPQVGLKLETIGVNNMNDISQALESLMKKVDGLYLLSDNMLASSVGLVKDKLIENQMISVSAEESQVRGGILITQGISYYELGRDTGKMAKEILVDGKDVADIPIGLSQNKDLKINSATLNKLNLDKNLSIFKDALSVD